MAVLMLCLVCVTSVLAQDEAVSDVAILSGVDDDFEGRFADRVERKLQAESREKNRHYLRVLKGDEGLLGIIIPSNPRGKIDAGIASLIALVGLFTYTRYKSKDSKMY
jgi:hypothetical protein